MEQSESIAALSEALAKAQGEFPTIGKDRRATIPTKTGGEFTYTYVDLASVIDHLRPVLLKHGLSFTQSVRNGETGFSVITQLQHASGEWQRTESPFMPYGDDARGTGSSHTYGRRYGLNAALGVAPDEDDDGALAQVKPLVRPTPQPENSGPSEYLEKKRKAYFAKAHDAGYDGEQAKKLFCANYELEHFNDGTFEQVEAACRFMDKKIEEAKHGAD